MLDSPRGQDVKFSHFLFKAAEVATHPDQSLDALAWASAHPPAALSGFLPWRAWESPRSPLKGAFKEGIGPYEAVVGLCLSVFWAYMSQ